VGFSLYDPVKKEFLYSFQDDRYFTPASNTKIFTLFASLKTLGDSIPGLKYIQNEDSLIIWGTGDPSFLYKNCFSESKIYDFLRNAEQPLYVAGATLPVARFGAGWAWDDYTDYYSPERSALPIYGNIFSIGRRGDSLGVAPRFFKPLVHVVRADQYRVVRNEGDNQTTLYANRSNRLYESDIPFRVDSTLLSALLFDTLKRPITLVQKKSWQTKVLYSVPSDSLYKIMMQESDNFIAEQLLILVAGILSDTLDPAIAIRRIKEDHLTDLKDAPVWVDGSGLSRYNLFTPRTIVQVWEKIYEQVPRERLFPLLATGGKNGTIKNWFKSDAPYIFGKTGSLSNNHCLSGFIVTRKGQTLIFSFMNSNFARPVRDVRARMEEVLRLIYDTL
jgi:D-alanyl-D-alanine carboxypeptidase/D-alanyl-D-alanine-endopeptidase (penicillin-binding protein 4)